MNTVHIEIRTMQEHVVLVKKDCWLSFADWDRWAVGKTGKCAVFLGWSGDQQTLNQVER
jgi:hypothetical protein